MRSSLALILAFAAATTVGCSNLDKLGAKQDDKKSSDDSAAADQKDQPVATDDQTNKPKDELSQLGLADFCQFDKNAQGKGCFTCTPRDLAITKCIDITGAFDAVKMCQHDLNEMTCKIDGAADDFVFNFDELTQAEGVYQKLPLLVFGAKALLDANLKNKPAIKTLVYGVLDDVMKYKKDLFTGGDMTAFLDDAGVLVKQARPSITDDTITTLKTQIKAAIADLRAKQAGGTFKVADVLDYATKMLAALPPELVGDAAKNLDLQKITDNLKAGSDKDMINELLAMLGDGQSVDDVVASLEGGN